LFIVPPKGIWTFVVFLLVGGQGGAAVLQINIYRQAARHFLLSIRLSTERDDPEHEEATRTGL
jgi:hypothetical protein